MNKFPGRIERGGRNHKAVILNAGQQEWLVKNYPTTENKRLARAMGCGIETVRSLARRLGVDGKSEEGLEAIRKRRASRAAKTNEKNGCYDRKRGRKPSEATIEGLRRRWQEIREGKRLTPQEKMRQDNPEGYAEMVKKRGAVLKEIHRKEQRRLLYGLERKTKRNVVLKPYTQSQTHHRHSALKRGYLLDYDCSEGAEGRYIIYYNDETERSKEFEENCRKDGFEIKPDA